MSQNGTRSRSLGHPQSLALIGQRLSALPQEGCLIGPRSRDSGGSSPRVPGADPLLFLLQSAPFLAKCPELPARRDPDRARPGNSAEFSGEGAAGMEYGWEVVEYG